MTRVTPIVSLFWLTAALAACAEDHPGFRDEEWNQVAKLSPVPPLPADPSNRYADDPGAAELGQMLFFETRWSGALAVASPLGAVGETGKVSCATCHDPNRYFADARGARTSTGIGVTPRNTPALVGSAHFMWPGWGGKQDSHWTLQGLLAEAPGAVLAGNRCGVAHLIFNLYRERYEAVFRDHPLPAALDAAAADASRFPAACKPKAAMAPDGAWEAMTPEDRDAVLRVMANVGKALHAYQRRLESPGSPFDRFVAGDSEAISPSAQRGLRLFVGKGACITCHSGPLLSDGEYHNIGVPQAGEGVPATDNGRYDDLPLAAKHALNGASVYSDAPEAGQARLAVERTDADLGAFRTPSLRNVAATAPYFHHGGAATLEEVIAHYDRGGETSGFAGQKDHRLLPLRLTEAERRDLVELMKSLTGDPVAEGLRTAPILP